MLLLGIRNSTVVGKILVKRRIGSLYEFSYLTGVGSLRASLAYN